MKYIIVSLILLLGSCCNGWCVHIPRSWYFAGDPIILNDVERSTSTFLIQVSMDREDVLRQSFSRYQKIYICYSGAELVRRINYLKHFSPEILLSNYQVTIVKWEPGPMGQSTEIHNFGIFYSGFVCWYDSSISLILYDKKVVEENKIRYRETKNNYR